jgi:hypothetical protein
MAQVQSDISARKKKFNRLWKMFVPLAGITASLSLIAFLYLGYDIAKGSVSPCESIFQQASVGLSTKIKFLKAEGELKLGRDKLAELSERAQMAALSLKTCCIVLDAGRIDPEQFLTCKAKTRAYDNQVENVVAKVQAASATSGAPAPALATAIETAIATSRDLNQSVVKISQEQQLQSLQTATAKKLSIDSTESEPNNDALNANVLTLAKSAKASIGIAKDVDVFTFTTPPDHRDWFRIELKNLSTTLEPNIELLDSEKTSVGSVRNTTAGGDVAYQFVAPPSTTYSFRVSSYYGAATGVYVVTATPEKAYDTFEPNETVLTATRMKETVPVKAKIMDKYDVDFFVVDAIVAGERKLKLSIANNSPTLHPAVQLFDASKTEITSTRNTTAGGDLVLEFKSTPGPVYVRISDYYQTDAGNYTLTVGPQ